MSSFSQIARLTTALRYVDTHSDLYLRESGIKNIKARAKVITFHVGSPPEMVLLSNPAWIALFVTIIAQYKNLKSNIPEILGDVALLSHKLIE